MMVGDAGDAIILFGKRGGEIGNGGGFIKCGAARHVLALTQLENPSRHTRTFLAFETRDKMAVMSARYIGPTDLSPSA